MNETIEGRAPGGHGGDANGDREGVITLVSNKQEFVRGSSPCPGQEIKPGSTQWETKPATEALPSELAKVDFGLFPKPQTIPTLGSCTERPWLFTNRTADESKVPYFPQSGRTSYTLPSANECQWGSSFKPTPTKARTTT